MVLAVLRKLANWYASRTDDYVSPFVRGMRRTNGTGKRERILTDDEIRAVWKAAPQVNSTFGALVKLALLTAQRREKLATMRWDDIADGLWTIRTEAREKGNPGVLKLPAMASEIIEAQPHIAGNPYVFAGSRQGQRRRPNKEKPVASPAPPHFDSWSARKAQLDAKLPDMPA
jgi:integrase